MPNNGALDFIKVNMLVCRNFRCLLLKADFGIFYFELETLLTCKAM